MFNVALREFRKKIFIFEIVVKHFFIKIISGNGVDRGIKDFRRGRPRYRDLRS